MAQAVQLSVLEPVFLEKMPELLGKVIDKALNVSRLDILKPLVSELWDKQSVDYPLVELQGQR